MLAISILNRKATASAAAIATQVRVERIMSPIASRSAAFEVAVAGATLDWLCDPAPTVTVTVAASPWEAILCDIELPPTVTVTVPLTLP